MRILEFDLKPNKKAVLRAVGCSEDSRTYDAVSRFYDEILEDALAFIQPYAAAEIENDRIYCVLSVGEGISDFSKSLFDRGEAVKGLLSDAIADEYLFEMDKILSEKIKLEGARLGVGVRSRLEAPEAFPLAEQQLILEKTGTDCVKLTEALMLSPVKSMAYILELSEDKEIFNAQHDCAACSSKDCPRRAVPYRSKIISAYSYIPAVSGDDAVCVDIGTTTIAMEYIKNGEVKKTYTALNPQRRFGADVLSRIEAANRGRLDELGAVIRYALKKSISEVTDGKNPDKIIVACNMTMTHLLMGYSCVTLGMYPFRTEHTDTIETELDGVPMSILGGISAFVGGDITSGLYMCDFDLSDNINLFIDLGTNGEMAVGGRDKIITTSAAAGPAFEGGRLSCSLSGTDIIAVIADMLDKKIIDSGGRLAEKYFEKGYKLREGVTVTQKDIREIQMAKAAVRAGVECLISTYGIELKDIETVYLAGGMGYMLSPEKAARIGLLPYEVKGKTKAVGNSSLGGAVKYACENERERIEHIREIAREFPLARHNKFNRLYLEHMDFGK